MTEPAAEKCTRCEGAPGAHQFVEGDCICTHRYDENEHPPAARIGYCCRACVARHRDWLREIGELWAHLPEVVPLGSVPDDTAHHKHTKQTGSPALMRLHAWALLVGQLRQSVHVFDTAGQPMKDDTGADIMIEAKLGAHLPDVRLTLCHHARELAGVDSARTVSAAIVVLRKHAEDIALDDRVGMYDAELGWILKALRDAHGIEPARPLGRCIEVRNGRDCGGWVREQPGNDPRCDRCGRYYGTHDLVRMQMETSKRSDRKARERKRLFSSREGIGRA